MVDRQQTVGHGISVCLLVLVRVISWIVFLGAYKSHHLDRNLSQPLGTDSLISHYRIVSKIGEGRGRAGVH